MPNNYEEAYSKFINYIERQLMSVQSKLKNVEYYNIIKKMINDLSNSAKSKDYSKFMEYYNVLSRISDDVKDNLDIICYLAVHNTCDIPQMEEAIQKVFSDKSLLKMISYNESKELLEGKKEKLTSIIDGTCDFETLKNALLDSDLEDEEMIVILMHEAQKTILTSRKKLPSLEVNENEKIINSNNEIINKINILIEKYYPLVSSKPNKLVEMYKKLATPDNIDSINSMYSEKDVRVCLHILYLIKLKEERDEVLNSKPVDYQLLELNTLELLKEYELSCLAISEFEKERMENIPQETSVYFLIDPNKASFDLSDLSDEEKKTIESMIKDLESGLFDYERNKNAHTMVKQNICKDLNVFVNRKKNICISYIRVNSKVLILCFGTSRDIFDLSKSILNTNKSLINKTISNIRDNDEEFISSEEEFRNALNQSFPKEVEPHHG